MREKEGRRRLTLCSSVCYVCLCDFGVGTGHRTGKFATHFTLSGCPHAELEEGEEEQEEEEENYDMEVADGEEEDEGERKKKVKKPRAAPVIELDENGEVIKPVFGGRSCPFPGKSSSGHSIQTDTERERGRQKKNHSSRTLCFLCRLLFEK